MGHGAYPQHECLNKERSDITYTHFLTNWFRLEITVVKTTNTEHLTWTTNYRNCTLDM
jgi:hypothetical protein